VADSERPLKIDILTTYRNETVKETLLKKLNGTISDVNKHLNYSKRNKHFKNLQINNFL